MRYERSVEARLRMLERRMKTMYHRTYAVVMRANRVKKDRAQYYRTLRHRLNNDNERLRKQVARLGCIIRRLSEGRSLVTLTPKEMQRFKKWLRQRPGYGPRKPSNGVPR